jgi:hypothetical protein
LCSAALLDYLSNRVDQTSKRSLQPFCKRPIDASNFDQQSVNHNPECTQEFGGGQLADEGTVELRDNFAWQQVNATAVNRWKAVTNARQCEGAVAYAAYHVFRLP